MNTKFEIEINSTKKPQTEILNCRNRLSEAVNEQTLMMSMMVTMTMILMMTTMMMMSSMMFL